MLAPGDYPFQPVNPFTALDAHPKLILFWAAMFLHFDLVLIMIGNPVIQ